MKANIYEKYGMGNQKLILKYYHGDIYPKTLLPYTLFFNSASRCLTILWIELQVLLWCCLIHIIIITLKHILYLVHMYPCLGLGLFISYLCNLFFIFSPFFIMNHIISLKQTQLFFVHFLDYFWMLIWKKRSNNF